MDKVIYRKSDINKEIIDLKRRIADEKKCLDLSIDVPTGKPRPDIVVIRALALKVTDLQRELDVINVMLGH